MADLRTRHLRQLRRLRRAARRWSVLAGTLGGATVVLVPYRGLGWPDAIWAALFGGSAALTYWRWSDLRELSAQPIPEPPDPALAGAAARARIEAVIARFPAGAGALAELRRLQSRNKLRGTSVLSAWNRLDQASRTLVGLAGRLDGSAGSAVQEAAVAERGLRDLGERTAAVERGLDLTPGDASLADAHSQLLARFTEGVDAYEQLVGAAAGCVAQDGHLTADTGSITRLIEATDLLNGIASGMAELRTVRIRPA